MARKFQYSERAIARRAKLYQLTCTVSRGDSPVLIGNTRLRSLLGTVLALTRLKPSVSGNLKKFLTNQKFFKVGSFSVPSSSYPITKGNGGKYLKNDRNKAVRASEQRRGYHLLFFSQNSQISFTAVAALINHLYSDTLFGVMTTGITAFRQQICDRTRRKAAFKRG